ncbi:MAG: response regulator transcription factor [Phycisphaeraceae bacterium]|nr:response regulator transcription factor [Phycisphaeraceae bacterium]
MGRLSDPLNILLVVDDQPLIAWWQRKLREGGLQASFLAAVDQPGVELKTAGEVDGILLYLPGHPDRLLSLTRQCGLLGAGEMVIALVRDEDAGLVVPLIRGGATEVVSDSMTDAELVKTIQHAMSQRQHAGHSTHLVASVRRKLATLSPREREILGLVARGLTSKQIARRLHRSEQTVALHRVHIMRKMDVHRLPTLIRMCLDSMEPDLASMDDPNVLRHGIHDSSE